MHEVKNSKYIADLKKRVLTDDTLFLIISNEKYNIKLYTIMVYVLSS